jgi:hypothetical protein
MTAARFCTTCGSPLGDSGVCSVCLDDPSGDPGAILPVEDVDALTVDRATFAASVEAPRRPLLQAPVITPESVPPSAHSYTIPTSPPVSPSAAAAGAWWPGAPSGTPFSVDTAAQRFKESWQIPIGTPSPPVRLWSIIAALGIVGGLTVIWSCYWGIKALSALGGGQLDTLLILFVLVVLAVPFCFGLGCIYLARRLQQGDRVARVLTVIVCTSAALAFLLSSVRDIVLVLVAVTCLVIAASLTADPVVRSHFTGPHAGHADEPTPVVAARVLVTIVGCCIFLIGIIFLPLADLDGILAFYGVVYLTIAIGLFYLSRGLSRGSAGARVVITLLALPYLIFSLLAGHGQPGVILPVGLSLSTVGLLWLPTSSRSYYASRPRPTQPLLASVERGLNAALASVSAPPAPAPPTPPPPAAGPMYTPVPPPAPSPAPQSTPADQDDPPPSAISAPLPPAPPSPPPPAALGPSPSVFSPRSASGIWARPDVDLLPGFQGSSRSPSRAFALTAVAAAIVLALDLILPPFAQVSSTPVWTFSGLHLDYESFRVAGEIHHYRATPWWLLLSLVAAALALVMSLVSLHASTPAIGWWLIVTGATSGLAALITSQLSSFGAQAGPGAWGALIAGAVVVAAGSGLVAQRLPAGRGLSALAGVGVLGLVIAAGPVFAHHPPSAPVSDSPGYQSPTVTTATPYNSSATPYQYSFSENDSDGATVTGTLNLGKPIAFSQGITEGNLTAGSACDISSGENDVAAGYLTITNSSSSDDDYIAVGLSWDSNEISAVEIGLSDGPTCEDDGQFGFISTNAIAPGESVTADLFVVFADANPGDADGSELTITDSTDEAGNNVEPVSLSGPGAQTSFGEYDIPIGGS